MGFDELTGNADLQPNKGPVIKYFGNIPSASLFYSFFFTYQLRCSILPYIMTIHRLQRYTCQSRDVFCNLSRQLRHSHRLQNHHDNPMDRNKDSDNFLPWIVYRGTRCASVRGLQQQHAIKSRIFQKDVETRFVWRLSQSFSCREIRSKCLLSWILKMFFIYKKNLPLFTSRGRLTAV